MLGLPRPPSGEPRFSDRASVCTEQDLPMAALSKCRMRVGRETRPAPRIAKPAPASGSRTQLLRGGSFPPPVPPAYALTSPAPASPP